MPEVLERAIDLALEKKDPRKTLERRRSREQAAARREASSTSGGTASEGVSSASSTSPPPEEEGITEKRERTARESCERSRYVSSAVRERGLERAGYQCEYTGSGGRRCTARAGLQVDHIDPFGKGGSLGEENLRILCRAHNLRAAEKVYGEEFIRRKIEGKTRGAPLR